MFIVNNMSVICIFKNIFSELIFNFFAKSFYKLIFDRFFTKTANGYQVKDELKNKVRFDYHNLKNDSGLRNLDIVFCRNVLIYFDDAAQTVAVNRFWDSMARQSYLFIGHSESLFGMDTKFEFLKTDWACLYQKQEK